MGAVIADGAVRHPAHRTQLRRYDRRPEEQVCPVACLVLLDAGTGPGRERKPGREPGRAR